MDGLKMSRFGHCNPFLGSNKGKQRKVKTRKVNALAVFDFSLLSFVLPCFVENCFFCAFFLKPDFYRKPTKVKQRKINSYNYGKNKLQSR